MFYPESCLENDYLFYSYLDWHRLGARYFINSGDIRVKKMGKVPPLLELTLWWGLTHNGQMNKITFDNDNSFEEIKKLMC